MSDLPDFKEFLEWVKVLKVRRCKMLETTVKRNGGAFDVIIESKTDGIRNEILMSEGEIRQLRDKIVDTLESEPVRRNPNG